MTPTRNLYLETAAGVVALLGDPRVASAWDRPSALERMTVGALAAHLSRSILQVDHYLDEPVPEREPMDAAAYYQRLGDAADLDSDLNAGVRLRAEQSSEGGPGGVHDEAEESLHRLTGRLPLEPEDRLIVAFGAVLTLDQYLETRLVEMTVHHDDLEASLGVVLDPPPTAAVEVAVGVMLEVAVRRHGRRAVLTALTRRERDTVAALRVL